MGNIDGGSPGDWSGFEAVQRMKSRRIENALHQEQLNQLRRKGQEEEGVAALARRAFGERQEQGRGEAPPEQLSGPGVEENAALFQQYAEGRTVAKQAGTMAEQFDDLARMSAGQGYITKAQEVAKTAALLRSREAAADASAGSAALSQIRTGQRTSQLIGQLYGGVTDQAGWDRANALYEFRTGQQSEYAGTPFNPATAQRVVQEALTSKERLDLQEKDLTRAAQEKYRTVRLDQIDTQNNIRQQRVDLEREREGRLAKQGGGKAVTAPSSAESTQAKRLIQSDFANMESRDLNDAAYSVAAEARALRRANPALNADQALQQAYASARAAGDFATDQGLLGSGIKAKTSFSGRGRTINTPLTIPAGVDGTALIKKTPVGRYVVNSKGQIGIRTKTGVQPVGAPTAEENSPDSEHDDDDEED